MNTQRSQNFLAIVLLASVCMTGYAGVGAETQQQKQGWSNKQVACVVVPLAVTAAGLGLYAIKPAWAFE